MMRLLKILALIIGILLLGALPVFAGTTIVSTLGPVEHDLACEALASTAAGLSANNPNTIYYYVGVQDSRLDDFRTTIYTGITAGFNLGANISDTSDPNMEFGAKVTDDTAVYIIGVRIGDDPQTAIDAAMNDLFAGGPEDYARAGIEAGFEGVDSVSKFAC